MIARSSFGNTSSRQKAGHVGLALSIFAALLILQTPTTSSHANTSTSLSVTTSSTSNDPSHAVWSDGSLATVASTTSAPTLGGPVILDGTDAASHGGAGNKKGAARRGDLVREWVYIYEAWMAITQQVARNEANGRLATNGRVAVIGTEVDTRYDGDARCYGMTLAVAHAVGKAQGLTGAIGVDYYNSDTDVRDLFTGIATGDAANIPAMIHIVEDNQSFHCSDSMSSAVQTELNKHAVALARYVNNGGGLHAQAHNFAWLTNLIPAATYNRSCGGTGLQLTEIAAADTVFFVVDEGALNASLVSPWHGCFTNFAPLRSMATGVTTNSDKDVVIGGELIILPVGLDVSIDKTAAPVGDTATITGRILNWTTGDAEQDLIFTVFDGPNGDATPVSVTTVNGIATFAVSSNRNGIDRIRVDDANGNLISATEVQWTLQGAISCQEPVIAAQLVPPLPVVCQFETSRDGTPYATTTPFVVPLSTPDNVWLDIPPSLTMPAGQSVIEFMAVMKTPSGTPPSTVRIDLGQGDAFTPVANKDTVTLNVGTPPDAPTALTAQQGGAPESALLSWTAPQNSGSSPVTGYRIEYAKDGGSIWTTAVANTNTTATTRQVGGLPTGNNLVFRVRAINADGPGHATASSDPVRPRRRPPEPRRNPDGSLPRLVPGAHQVRIGSATSRNLRFISHPGRSILAGEDFRIELWNVDGDREQTDTAVGNVLRVPQGGDLALSVDGFAPHSLVSLFMFSTPTLLGRFLTDNLGDIDQDLSEILATVLPCAHTLQAEGRLTNGSEVTAAMGIWVLANPFPFADVTVQGSYAPGIGCLEAKGIVTGYSRTAYKEHDPISRAQAASIVARSLGLDTNRAPAFSDTIDPTHAGAIAALADRGIVNGYADGRFHPHGTISRREAEMLLASATGLTITDIRTTLDATGAFGAPLPVTRGEFASMVALFLAILETR